MRLALTIAFALAAHLIRPQLSLQLIAAVCGYALVSAFAVTVEHFLPPAALTSA